MITYENEKLFVTRTWLEKYYPAGQVRKKISLGNFIVSENDKNLVEYKSVLETNSRVRNSKHKKDLPSEGSLLNSIQIKAQKEQVAQQYKKEEGKNLYNELIELVKTFYKGDREAFFAGEYGPQFAYDFAQSSAWLDFLLSAKRKKSILKQFNCELYKHLLEFCIVQIKKEDLRGLKVSSVSSLQNCKLAAYRKAKKMDKENYWKSVADARLKTSKENAYKAKLSDKSNFQTFHFATLVGLFANYDNPQILNATGMSSVYEQYLEICNEYGVKPLTERSVRRFPHRSDAIFRIMRSRFGNGKVKSEIMPYISAKVTYANEFVCWDGIPIRAAWVDKNGKLHYQYNILPILDYASGVCLGVSMGETENTEMFVEAMQQAFVTTKGRKFRYTISDSGSAFTSYEGTRITKMVSEQHDYVKNVHAKLQSFGKSPNKNPAERFARMIQERFRKFTWFGGLSLKAKKQTINEDNWNPTKEHHITEADLRYEIASVLAEFSSQMKEGKSSLDWYYENIHPKSQHLLAWQSNYAFGDMLSAPINVKKGAVRFKNQDYLITNYDELIEKGVLVNSKARVRFNPKDLTTIDLWSVGNPQKPKDFSKDTYLGTYGLKGKTMKSPLEQTSETWKVYDEQMKVVTKTADKIVEIEKQDKDNFNEIMAGEFQIEEEMRARYPFATKTAKVVQHEATQDMMRDRYLYKEPIKKAVGAEFEDFTEEKEEPNLSLKPRKRWDRHRNK